MNIQAKIGPAFGDELKIAGLGDGIVWTPSGVTIPDDYAPTLRDRLDAVIAAHDPTKPAPGADVVVLVKSELYQRMTDAEYDAMLAGVAGQSKRVQDVFAMVETFRSDAALWPLLNTMAVKLYGETRAAELLTPPAA